MYTFKRNIFLLFAIFFVIRLSAQTDSTPQKSLPTGFTEYTLTNNMKCYVYEDFSTALVRIEYTAYAGFNRQTSETAGFFPLYTHLFQSAGKEDFPGYDGRWFPDDMKIQCGTDSARYIITVSPDQVETVLKQTAACAFAPLFSNDDIQTQFSISKKEVMQYAFSTAGFINSSIDARIFADAPWKQDSGIYPSLFTNMPIAQVRTILTDIAQTYYSPRNSTVFISGAIPSEQAYMLAEKYFGAYKNSKFSPDPATVFEETDTVQPQKTTDKPDDLQPKRYVLTDPAFTPDMTQIVVQYTDMPMTAADILAAVINGDESDFKTSLAADKKLGIRGMEYINAAAVHQRGFSRLIIQSLMEPVKNSSPLEQSEIFFRHIQDTNFAKSDDLGTSNEFEKALKTLAAGYNMMFTGSSSFMDILSQYAAINSTGTSDTVRKLLVRPETIITSKAKDVNNAFHSVQPWIFTLVNSDVYKKYRSSFEKNGYTLVTAKNGSWYTQNLYNKIEKRITEDSRKEKQNTISPGQTFVQANRSQFQSFALKNGIPVTVKESTAASTVVIAFSISDKGMNNKEAGFTEIVSDILAQNIRAKLDAAVKNGTISGAPDVKAQTRTIGGFFTVECLPDDVKKCLNCISEAIIYGTIPPALADSIVYDIRSRHRIQAADLSYQLYGNAIRIAYKDDVYRHMFPTQSEILEHIQYRQILAAYPQLLDAKRYHFILTGAVPTEGLEDAFETTFGPLVNQTSTDKSAEGQSAVSLSAVWPVPVFPSKRQISVKLTHQFLTNVPADKAGPRPEILVPTKTFSDPVQFWIQSPDPATSDFTLFNALLYEFTADLKKLVAQQPGMENATVHLQSATTVIQVGVVTILNVPHTSAAYSLYAAAEKELLAALDTADAVTASQTAEIIRNRWISKSLPDTQTVRGTALLIQKGLEKNSNAEQYLDDYEAIISASAEQFADVAEKYIRQTKPLELYSSDAEK